MLQQFPTVILLVNGLLYCVLAWLFIDAPITWFARLGIELQQPLGYTELKTMYIGLMGSLGVYSLLATCVKSLQSSALLLFLLSYFALAMVRSWGIFIEGVYDDFMVQLLYTEVVSALLCGLALLVRSRNA